MQVGCIGVSQLPIVTGIFLSAPLAFPYVRFFRKSTLNLPMVSSDEVVQELKTVDKNVRIAPHSHRRASQRNIDLEQVKQKIRDLNFHKVRENNQKDPRYGKTYKVVIEASENSYYEMPIYFNIHGNEIYLKSVWNK